MNLYDIEKKIVFTNEDIFEQAKIRRDTEEEISLSNLILLVEDKKINIKELLRKFEVLIELSSDDVVNFDFLRTFGALHIDKKKAFKNFVKSCVYSERKLKMENFDV
jgi:hypothetical protein